jgi:hypothetical protein
VQKERGEWEWRRRQAADQRQSALESTRMDPCRKSGPNLNLCTGADLNL